MEENEKKLLLKVEFNDETQGYEVTVPQGSSALEVVFGMAVITKIFERDGIMTKEEVIENLNRYLNDSQYEEVTPLC